MIRCYPRMFRNIDNVAHRVPAAHRHWCRKYLVGMSRKVRLAGLAFTVTSLPPTRLPVSFCANRVRRPAVMKVMRNTPRSPSEVTTVFSKLSKIL